MIKKYFHVTLTESKWHIRIKSIKQCFQTHLIEKLMRRNCLEFIHVIGSNRIKLAEVHLNLWARSTFPVPVCIVPSSMVRTSQCDKVEAVRLYAPYRLNLLLLKGQRWVYLILVCKIKTRGAALSHRKSSKVYLLLLCIVWMWHILIIHR